MRQKGKISFSKLWDLKFWVFLGIVAPLYVDKVSSWFYGAGFVLVFLHYISCEHSKQVNNNQELAKWGFGKVWAEHKGSWHPQQLW